MSRLRPLAAAALLIVSLALSGAGLAVIPAPAVAAPAAQTQQCVAIKDPSEIQAPGLIHFDDLDNAKVIGDHYRPTHGVRFEDSATTRAIIYGNEPEKARSKPNVAINNAVFPATSEGVPMRMLFDEAKTHVGMWIGNGENEKPIALLTGYNEQ